MAYTYQQIENLWVQNGGSADTAPMAAAVAMAESSGNPNAFNGNDPHGGSFGLFQINGAHGAQATYDVNGNVQAAIAISNNGANWKAWGAYTNGSYAKYLDPSTQPNGDTVSNGTTGLPIAGNGTTSILTPSPYSAPTGTVYSDQQLAALNQELNIPLQIDDGLSNTPWYSDNNLITGNPKIRKSVQPLTFQVYLSRQTGEMLHDPSNPSTPISLELNTSLKTFELTSKHVYNRTPSRTGMHVTFWGMQPDLISGSGTTGVFMNQFGLTDFFSVANITSDVKQLVTQGFKRMFNPTAMSTAQASTGAVTVSNANFNGSVSNLTGGSANEAFRVAAQDAFVELLKLFQMNGNVWFHTKNYNGVFGSAEQGSPSAWNTKTGASVTQQHGRNNDVMVRGYVAMKWRNSVFLGYFKSLTWTMDAEKPFQWLFQFVFQVEQTYTTLYQSASSAPNPAAGITSQTGI